jgi:hypothetical protein
MRLVFIVLLLAAAPCLAQPDTAIPRPPEASNLPPTAAEERNAARWADRDAEERVTDGDYDGAVQAEHQANVDRHEADDQDTRAPRR